jgi:hypothetical protein
LSENTKATRPRWFVSLNFCASHIVAVYSAAATCGVVSQWIVHINTHPIVKKPLVISELRQSYQLASDMQNQNNSQGTFEQSLRPQEAYDNRPGMDIPDGDDNAAAFIWQGDGVLGHSWESCKCILICLVARSPQSSKVMFWVAESSRDIKSLSYDQY